MRRSDVSTLKIGAFPSGAALNKTILYTLGAVAFFLVPFFLPDLGRDAYKQAAINHISDFEIDDPLHQGLFSLTSGAGDTSPNNAASFMGLATQMREGIPTQGRELAAAFVQELESQYFNNTAQTIYEGIVQLKGLGLLDLGDARSNQLVEKYYNYLLSFAERHSAFRRDSISSPSVDATYFAFESFKELGKADAFKATEEFTSAIQFVASMKDPDTGGFRNGPGQPSSITATFYALQILTTDANVDSKSYEGVDSFVFSCQAKDGGFHQTSLSSEPLKQYYAVSSCTLTTQAIYILETLRELSQLGTMDSIMQYSGATNYLHSCLTLTKGAIGSFPSSITNLEATYFFSMLSSRFPSVSFGIPPAVRFACFSVADLFLLAAIHAFYSGQVVRKADAPYLSLFKTSLVYLTLGAIATQLYPPAAIVAYLLLAVQLAMKYVEIASTDSEGFMTLFSLVNTATLLVPLAVFMYSNPTAFFVWLVYVAFAAWSATITFIVTLAGVWGVGEKSMKLYTDSAVMAWITNTILMYSLLYGGGEFIWIGRVLMVHGHFLLVFVTIPLGSLALMCAAAVLGTSLAVTPPKKRAGRSGSSKAIGGASRRAIAAGPSADDEDN